MNPATIAVEAGIFVGFLLSATMLLALLEAAVDYARHGKSRRQLFVSGAYVAGLLVGGIVAWLLIALGGWHLSFWTTVKASVDAATYTHRVEHMAENILVWTGFSAVACGSLSAFAAAFASKRAPRLRSA